MGTYNSETETQYACIQSSDGLPKGETAMALIIVALVVKHGYGAFHRVNFDGGSPSVLVLGLYRNSALEF